MKTKHLTKEITRPFYQLINITEYLINFFPFLGFKKMDRPSNLINVNDVDKKHINIEKIYKDDDFEINVYQIKNGSVYTTYGYTIDDKNNIIKELSCDFAPNKFKNHPFYDKRYAPPAKIIKGNVAVLASNSSDNNYYHWLIETLPKIFIYKNANVKIDKYFAPIKNKFHKQTLELLGIKQNQLINAFSIPFIKADNIISTTPVFKYPKTFDESLSSTGLKLCSKPLKVLRNEILNRIPLKKIQSYKRIFISREKAVRRKAANENQLSKLMEEFSFTKICLEDFNFIEQVQIFKNAEIIAGIHGAGFANIIFCNPKTSLIDMQGNKADFYKELAEIFDIKYFPLYFNENEQKNIDVDIIKLRKSLLNITF